jgi:8-oxo-dGTP pyrophosphatase MutT (NUDIX family)
MPHPRESATLVLMRERPGAAPEVLLVRRHGRNAVAAGAFVFPGGLLEQQDYAGDALALSACLDPDEAARILGTALSRERALGHFMAAIRETFEEVGILLARDRLGRPWRPKADEAADLNAARAAMRAGRFTFAQWLEQRGLRPAVGDLAYFAHWITPQAMARRFDTRFFLAEVDADASAEPDQTEVVECRWIAASDALAAYRDRTMQMVNATVKNLELIAEFSSAAEAREHLRERRITAIMPKAVPQGDGFRIVNPWEAGYDAL